MFRACAAFKSPASARTGDAKLRIDLQRQVMGPSRVDMTARPKISRGPVSRRQWLNLVAKLNGLPEKDCKDLKYPHLEMRGNLGPPELRIRASPVLNSSRKHSSVQQESHESARRKREEALGSDDHDVLTQNICKCRKHVVAALGRLS
jgi:hypothetical protein